MLMQGAGFDNVFENVSGGWACVNEGDVVAAAPDVIVVVDAAWDTALSKLTKLYDNDNFCDMDAVKGARLVRIPFSATEPGPRNGPAALDLAIAAVHVRTGAMAAVRESGVSTFEPHTIEVNTQGLRCTSNASSTTGDSSSTTGGSNGTRASSTGGSSASVNSVTDEEEIETEMNGSGQVVDVVGIIILACVLSLQTLL
jgi:hypothetical protein